MDRNFSNWIEAYKQYTANSEAPDVFHEWTAISVIAGALRRRCWLGMGLFNWYPNFYICFIAPPGIVAKSTTSELGHSLLRAVPGIVFGPTIITWQAIMPALEAAHEEFQLPNGDFMPQSALTVVASELGTLLQPGDAPMITLLTDLWDGKEAPIVKQTKGEGLEVIVNPWINLIGCTTPSWVAENWSSYFVGGGFASRVLFVYAEHKRRLVAYPFMEVVAGQDSLRERLIEDLCDIAKMQGHFTMTGDAVRWGRDWYENRHFSVDNPLWGNPTLAGYAARKQTHIHKTAMVLSAARASDRRITGEILEEAEAIVSALEPNILSVFGQMNKEAVTDQMARVLEAVRARGTLTKSALYRAFVTQMGFDTFSECVQGLIGAGLIEERGTAEGAVLRFVGEDVVKRMQGGVS